MTNATTSHSVESIVAVADQVYQSLLALVDTLPSPIPERPYQGEWNTRQLLSHIIGSYQRIATHAGYFLAETSETVPVTPHDPFYLADWVNAPTGAFRAALVAAYQGVKAIAASLSPDDLATIRMTPFGDMALGDFLLGNLVQHLGGDHVPQLETLAKQF
jgi:hypothetical protein